MLPTRDVEAAAPVANAILLLTALPAAVPIAVALLVFAAPTIVSAIASAAAAVQVTSCKQLFIPLNLLGSKSSLLPSKSESKNENSEADSNKKTSVDFPYWPWDLLVAVAGLK